MHWKLAFPSDYISSADLRGKDVPLTISAVNHTDVRVIDGKGKGDTEKKLVLDFEELQGRGKGQPRKMVLNKTNAKSIANLHGNEVKGWLKKRITLYPTTCLAFGKTEDCIRVRDTLPPPKRKQNQEPPPEPDPMPSEDESPFPEEAA